MAAAVPRLVLSRPAGGASGGAAAAAVPAAAADRGAGLAAAAADGEDTLFCVCRRPWGGGAMVCCDKCESWYHPGCIGMSLQVHQDLVDGDHEWFCHKCEDTADGSTDGAAAETAAADGAAAAGRDAAGVDDDAGDGSTDDGDDAGGVVKMGALVCSCQRPFAGELVLQCSCCSRAYHPDCVGLAQWDDWRGWRCSSCPRYRTRRRQQPDPPPPDPAEAAAPPDASESSDADTGGGGTASRWPVGAGKGLPRPQQPASEEPADSGGAAEGGTERGERRVRLRLGSSSAAAEPSAPTPRVRLRVGPSSPPKRPRLVIGGSTAPGSPAARPRLVIGSAAAPAPAAEECKACRGWHRAHTCGRGLQASRARRPRGGWTVGCLVSMAFEDEADGSLRDWPGKVEAIDPESGLMTLSFDDGGTESGVRPDDPDLRQRPSNDTAAAAAGAATASAANPRLRLVHRGAAAEASHPPQLRLKSSALEEASHDGQRRKAKFRWRIGRKLLRPAHLASGSVALSAGRAQRHRDDRAAGGRRGAAGRGRGRGRARGAGRADAPASRGRASTARDDTATADAPEQPAAPAAPAQAVLCPVCLCDAEDPVMTPCSHWFCRTCLARAAKECGRRCPMCRRSIFTFARVLIDNMPG